MRRGGRATTTARPPASRRGGDRPLAHVRIVSLAQNLPGPLAVARLVGAGASAVKVEPPGGDPMATLAERWYHELHRGVRVRRLDLKSARGLSQFHGLLAGSSLLVTSQRPAALARLGLAPSDLSAAHPHVRVLQIVGDTDAPDIAGHDLTYQARAGLVGSDMPRTLLADLFGAERAVAAALLLLGRTGPAVHQVGLRDALDDATRPLMLGLTSPGGVLGGGLATYAVYEARRGRVAVAALEPHFRDRLYERLGVPPGGDLTEVFRTRTARQWEAWASRHDLPLAAVARLPAGAKPRRRRSR